MLLLTLRGTPTIYYGDEIGMHDVPIPPERVQDPFEKNVPGKGLGRDSERTPMQWSSEENSGFTAGEPWLPIAEDFHEVNVDTERNDPRSILTLYRRLLELRRGEPALEVGGFEPLEAEGDMLAYIRRTSRDEREFLIALNLGSQPQVLRRYTDTSEGTIELSTHLDRSDERVQGDLQLRPNEGLLIRLDQNSPR